MIDLASLLATPATRPAPQTLAAPAVVPLSPTVSVEKPLTPPLRPRTTDLSPVVPSSTVGLSTTPTPTPKAEEAVDTTTLQDQLDHLLSALQSTPMGDVQGHMQVLQHELQSTEYLVDMLQPEDIGLLVKAQRVMMEEDILLNSAPKGKVKAKGKKAIVDPKVTANDFAIGDLFG